MALTKESMATFVETRLAAVTATQTNNAAAVSSYRRLVLEALCQGIIDEITTNAVVQTTSGAPDGEHQGNIS